jgi:3-hydroxy acid dehydrogenase/malonic semialdehyde reductase
MDLNVVITGASAGIGSATARRFARQGYRLTLLARRIEKLEELRQELKGTDVSVYALDVSCREDVERTFAEIETDILVNNAGIAFGLEPAQQGNLDEWERCVDVNIKGLLYCTRSVLPGMIQRGRGHIVNLGSTAGHYPYGGGSVYCGTKAFVHQFSLSLRSDLLGTPIRVSCVEPGLTGGTEFSKSRFRGDAEKAHRIYEKTQPLTPEDVADVIFYATSLPAHVNLNSIEMMPVVQAFAPLAVHKSIS